MNKVILMGRLTRDPDVRYSAGESGTSVARYTLAVDRRFNKRDGEATADLSAVQRFGTQCRDCRRSNSIIGTEGSRYRSYQTGSYTNRDGNKVYTTDVVVEDQEFAESKAASQANGNNYTPARPEPSAASGDGFMNIPDGIDEELPFNQTLKEVYSNGLQ